MIDNPIYYNINPGVDCHNNRIIDKIFNVVTPEYAANNPININCGKKNCRECLNCYKKDSPTIINEILK